MTGAPLPAGANAVAKHEDCRVAADGTVRLPPGGLQPGAGVMQRGASFAAGEIVLSAGKRISPIDMGMLAEVGRSSVLAAARPRVAVLATGNELVEVGVAPGPGQIVNSNGPMLLAWLEQLGAAATDLGIARDDPAGLEARMAAGLEHDVLLVSGGVSAGVMDLVPGVLERLGVRQVFHKIRMKPGKPLWFGVRVQDDRRTLVFGLPGNPVSTLASFVLFVKPALRALAGGGFVAEDIQLGVLAAEVSHRGPRPTYYPCVAKCVVGELNVEPLRWRGSSDLAALTRANALAVLPEGDYRLEAGRRVELVWLNR
jgi:molybdopterin molybdotransferase